MPLNGLPFGLSGINIARGLVKRKKIVYNGRVKRWSPETVLFGQPFLCLK